MNPGLNIFKRAQRLQGGDEDVPLAGRAARKVQDLSIEALQNLPEWLKRPIRQGVGRVATNVVEPFGYGEDVGINKVQDIAALFSPQELSRTLSSIIQDRSAVRSRGGEEDVTEEDMRARRPLFREYFDLPTQDTDKVFTHQGKNYRINPETKNETAQFVLKQFKADVPGTATTNMISRGYHSGRPDPWDFAPHADELAKAKGKPLDASLFGRMLLESIGKPATLETGGYYNPPPKEGVDVAQNTGGGLARGTADVGLGIFKRFQKGTGNVMDLERGNWPVSEEELRTLPDWLAHLLRGIPKEHTHGSQREQFRPRSVPVFQGPQGKYYDPDYSREDERIMAAKGTSDVQHLAGGSGRVVYMGPGVGDPPNQATTWGKWGDRLGPNSVAVSPFDIRSGKYHPGQWIQTPEGWKQVQDVSYVRKGKPNPSGTLEYWLPKGARPGGGGGTIPGGPFEGWTPQAMDQWHSGTPPSQMNYPSFTGNTAGPGGTPLAYNTTSYQIPGYGWVPQANLANAQASNNLWDYMNPFGGTSKGGANTGDPTQRGVGMAVGTASNFIIPGLGFVTGPIARWITSKFQGQNPTPKQVQQAVAQAQAQGKLPPMPTGSVSLPTQQPQGGGFDPYGNPARGREYWSGDFGRGLGGPSLSSAGGTRFGQLGTGFGTGTVGNFATAIGFGGNLGGGGPVDASRYRGASGYSRPFSAEQWANMPGAMKYPAPAISQAWGGVTPRLSYEQYLNAFHAPGTVGSSTGPGGAAQFGTGGPAGFNKTFAGVSKHTPKISPFAMGTSNVGLKLFHKTQLKRKNQTQ